MNRNKDGRNQFKAIGCSEHPGGAAPFPGTTPKPTDLHNDRDERENDDREVTDLLPQCAFFLITSAFWTVGAWGALIGVDMSIVGLVDWVLPPSQPKFGATKAQPRMPSIETRSGFRVIRVPLTRVVGMKRGKTKTALAQGLDGEKRNLHEQSLSSPISLRTIAGERGSSSFLAAQTGCHLTIE